MSFTRIRLPRGEWFFDPDRPLGSPGGFGEVFEAQDGDGNPLAVKRLKVSAGEAAHRELDIAHQLAGRKFEHVLEVLDSGEDTDTGRYFVVMPRAEGDLAHAITMSGPLPTADAVGILLEIASGLAEVPEIAHRDLKPANVLRRDGRWKIADFGIAKFVEDTTSLNTLRDSLTPPFAAPEQWRAEHPDPTTDIYALSCIAYVLLTGLPPFAGPTIADYRNQHLTALPPALLDAVDPRLRTIVSAGLRKPPSGRPRLARVCQVLQDIHQNPAAAGPGIRELQSVNAQEAQRISEVQAEQQRLQRAAADRAEMIAAGEATLEDVALCLEAVIRQHASETRITRLPATPASRVHKRAFQLGHARLDFECQGSTPPNATFTMSGWETLGIGLIRVRQETREPWQCGATLWFMRRRPEEGFRWFQVAYKFNAFARAPHVGPFPIQDLGNDIYGQADMAAGPGMHTIEIESGPTPIDDEDSERFVEQWANLLAQAYKGRLRAF